MIFQAFFEICGFFGCIYGIKKRLLHKKQHIAQVFPYIMFNFFPMDFFGYWSYFLTYYVIYVIL